MGGFLNSPIGVVIGYSIGSMYVFALKYVLSTTKSLIQADLKLTDAQAGALYTVYLIAIMIASPILGYAADVVQKYKKHIAIWGLVLDGVSTCACSICYYYPLLIIPRILAGVGDGAFSTIAPSILSDYFPPTKRNMVITTFFSISNAGAIIGFALSGFFGDTFGWRATCVFLGLPGVLGLALFIFGDPKPVSAPDSISIYDRIELEDYESEAGTESESASAHTDTDSSISDSDGKSISPAPTDSDFEMLNRKEQIKKFIAEMMEIFTAPYTVSVVGFLFNGVTIAAIADWGTSFLIRYFDLTVTYAGTFCGSITIICAFVGTAAGGVICEYAGRYIHKNPILVVSGVTLFASNFFLVPATIITDDVTAAFPCAMEGIAFILNYISFGPMNAYVINSVAPELRSRALGITHTFRNFGGCIAPSIVGAISDAHYGDLKSALLVAPMSNVIAAIVWILASFILPKGSGPVMTEDDEKKNRGEYNAEDIRESIYEGGEEHTEESETN